MLLSFALVAILSASGVATAADVTATQLDGQAVSGSLVGWSTSQVTVKTEAGSQAIEIKGLLSVRWQSTPPPAAAQDGKPAVVELVDGTILPIENYTVSGVKATVTIAGADLPPNAKTLVLDVRQVASVRLKPIPQAIAPQWDEARGQNLPSDVIVVFKREGQSLDYAEGVIGDVTADRVNFELDNRPTRVDRGQAAGIIYYRRNVRTAGDPLCIVQGRSGLRAVVAKASLAGESLQLTTAAGVELSWPLSDVLLADFSAGKLAYLSDLEAATQTWTPLVGLPSGFKSVAAYGRPRRDLSGFGGPLALLFHDDASPSAPVHERAFSKGLAIRSRTELAYRLPAGFRRFVAVAGIDPATSVVGNVMLIVKGDDRVLFEQEIAGDKPPVPIELKIDGVRRLTMVVDYGRNLDNGDWLNLCDARIVK